MGSFLRFLTPILDGPGLLLVALVDSSFLTIPEGNDLLIVLLSAGNSWHKMTYYVLMTIIGSMMGCVLLYIAGRKGGSPLLKRKFQEQTLSRVERLFAKYGVFTVILPSILPPPCPFKVFVLSAGAFRLKLGQFLFAVAVGRTVRYSMWGVLAVLYGDALKGFMQSRMTDLGIALFVMFLLILTVLVIRHYYRAKQNHPATENKANS